MYTASLRKVGGSVMVAIPPALLDVLHLTAGAKVDLAVDNGRLVVEPKARPGHTMAELLAASDYSQPQPPEEREWMEAPAVGGERKRDGAMSTWSISSRQRAGNNAGIGR